VGEWYTTKNQGNTNTFTSLQSFFPIWLSTFDVCFRLLFRLSFRFPLCFQKLWASLILKRCHLSLNSLLCFNQSEFISFYLVFAERAFSKRLKTWLSLLLEIDWDQFQFVCFLLGLRIPLLLVTDDYSLVSFKCHFSLLTELTELTKYPSFITNLVPRTRHIYISVDSLLATVTTSKSFDLIIFLIFLD
jgi:hypothetical protein